MLRTIARTIIAMVVTISVTGEASTTRASPIHPQPRACPKRQSYGDAMKKSTEHDRIEQPGRQHRHRHVGDVEGARG